MSRFLQKVYQAEIDNLRIKSNTIHLSQKILWFKE